MKKALFFVGFFVFSGIFVFAQNFSFEKSSFVYKEIDGISLEMIVYKPEISSTMKLPAIVFYFGGGWVNGTTSQFEMQAEYLVSRGIVVVCPDYRIKSKHNTSPFESVKDARSAMRYLKQHGSELGIDTSKIVASGGSAGGHLAAGTAILNEINESSDNLTIPATPFAMVLFNPVVDTGERGYGQGKMGGHEFEISPVHQITFGVPPTLIMHGKDDKTVLFENVVRFKHSMIQQGNKCTLKAYRKQGHGFFNFNKKPNRFKKTLKNTESFLEDLDLLRGTSWINKYCKGLKLNS